MLLETLRKLATTAIEVANNKTEKVLNKGIEKLEEMKKEQNKKTKTKNTNCVITAELSTNTDLTILVSTQDRCEKFVFKKGEKEHKTIINQIKKSLKETGVTL